MNGKPETRKGFIYTFIIFLIAIGIYLGFEKGYFQFGRGEKKGLIKAYQLYTATEQQKEVVLFLGRKEIEYFVQYKTRIFETENLINQIKQVLLLLVGDLPRDGDARAGFDPDEHGI